MHCRTNCQPHMTGRNTAERKAMMQAWADYIDSL
jgi:hypothetical protein